MKKTTEFKRENFHKTVIRGTMNLSYYALCILDTTELVNEEIADDLFISYQNGFLELALHELQQIHKRLNYQILDEGNNTAKVKITLQPLWKKR